MRPDALIMREALDGKVEDFELAGDGVTGTLEDGGELEGTALMGADGLWQNIRAKLIGDGAPRVSGHIAYRAVLPAADMPPHLQWNEVVL